MLSVKHVNPRRIVRMAQKPGLTVTFDPVRITDQHSVAYPPLLLLAHRVGAQKAFFLCESWAEKDVCLYCALAVRLRLHRYYLIGLGDGWGVSSGLGTPHEAYSLGVYDGAIARRLYHESL